LKIELNLFSCMCVIYRWEMAQILLHGNLHVTIYEVDKIGEGGGHGFFHKVFVLSFLCYGSMLLILITSFFFLFFFIW
jgi:hypothetical protein